MMRLYPVCHGFPTVVASLQQKHCVLICFLLVNLDFISMSSVAPISTADPLSTKNSATSYSANNSAYPESSTSTPATSILFTTMINTASTSSDITSISTTSASSTELNSNRHTSVHVTSTPATSILFMTMINTASSSSDITSMSTTSASSTLPNSSKHTSANVTSTPATSVLFSTIMNAASNSSDITSMSTKSASSTVLNSSKHTSAYVSTSSILSSTCKIPSVSGGVAAPSAGGTAVVISCFSGFNIQGASVLQCVNGSWNFPVPTCFRESHLKSDVHNKIDVNDIGLPTWLLWTLCAVFGLLGLLLLCCVLYICLKMCGCVAEPVFGFNQVHPYASRRVCCCRDGLDPGDGDYVRRHKQRQRRDTELTFSLPNENGRRGNSRRIRSFSDSGLSSQPPESPETNRKLVVKVRKKKRAKSIPTWLPHSNPLRDINTSTK